MSNSKSANNKSIENKKDSFDHDKQSNDKNSTNRVRSSTKRPRAPIACFRCHHKKVRCDGARPNCTRCLTTGVLCAYPSSRRSRTTQPTNVDPFIDNLSHLEARIRQIEVDLASQRSMVHSILSSPNDKTSDDANDLNNKMLKTEIEVQDSRSILAQLRLRGEQRILKGKRAAAAAAAAAAASATTATTSSPKPETKSKPKPRKPKSTTTDNGFYCPMDYPGMDWTLFERDQPDKHQQDLVLNQDPLFSHPYDPQGYLAVPAIQSLFSGYPDGIYPKETSPGSTRSSSLASHLAFPVVLQPSNSTHSAQSNVTATTSCSSMNSCDNIFNFAMEDVMMHPTESGQDVNMLNHQPSSVWYYS